jgi:hypothetical protein
MDPVTRINAGYGRLELRRPIGKLYDFDQPQCRHFLSPRDAHDVLSFEEYGHPIRIAVCSNMSANLI